ncbi:hypothetical protein AB9Q10_08685 [Streptomyces krungchingensis]|uniref:MmyB family transcriptional regulator n=1 Tax=Streptomyces krungchingensis TaxID=1565034 RepID=UPI003CF2F858
MVRGHRCGRRGPAPGRAPYAGVCERAVGRPNPARFVYLADRADEVFPARDHAADTVVALPHAEAARSRHSRAVTGPVGELATRSEEFRTRWAADDVQAHRRGTERVRHPPVGELTLRFEALEIAAAGGLTLIGCTAEPGCASREALRLLARGTTEEGHPAARQDTDAAARTSPGE